MTEETPEPAPQAAGGRYQRSTAGMIGAMIVTLGVILAFVAFRAINRNDPDIRPEPIDYRPIVEGVQKGGDDAGLKILYPAELPDGWIAIAAAFDPGRLWSLSLLTKADHYVGVRQGPGKVDDFVEEYVDEDAKPGDPVTLTSADGDKQTWETFTDANGDYALVRSEPQTIEAAEGGAPTETGLEIVVLVVGTAGEDQVRDLAADLTTEPID